jgi:hypothetical protein
MGAARLVSQVCWSPTLPWDRNLKDQPWLARSPPPRRRALDRGRQRVEGRQAFACSIKKATARADSPPTVTSGEVRRTREEPAVVLLLLKSIGSAHVSLTYLAGGGFGGFASLHCPRRQNLWRHGTESTMSKKDRSASASIAFRFIRSRI